MSIERDCYEEKADRVRKPGCFPFKAKPLHALLLAVLACWQMDMRASQTEHTAGRMPPARAQHIEFNSSFLRGGDGIDVLRFAEGNSVEPGLYNPDLLVNGNWMARTENGIKLQETTVAPGDFVIDDLYPTGYGGDLQVDIEEADGSVRSFSVPYAAVPRSLREGQHRYSLTAGVQRQPGSRLNAGANALYRRPYTLFSGSVSRAGPASNCHWRARRLGRSTPEGSRCRSPGRDLRHRAGPACRGRAPHQCARCTHRCTGCAVVPYMTPYAMNEVSLDPKGMSMDVELQEANRRVAPVAGAAAMVVFKTSYSRSGVLRLTQAERRPCFGAVVSDESGKDLGWSAKPASSCCAACRTRAAARPVEGRRWHGPLQHGLFAAGAGALHRLPCASQHGPALRAVPSCRSAVPSGRADTQSRDLAPHRHPPVQPALPGREASWRFAASLRISVLRTTADAKQYTARRNALGAGRPGRQQPWPADRSQPEWVNCRDSPTHAQASVGV
ncbi:Ras GTPase-activating protein 2 [Manis javanica]|nr:Ras GTPase-activating protein 2 [Manis javanica]